jgi:hypothetical protein
MDDLLWMLGGNSIESSLPGVSPAAHQRFSSDIKEVNSEAKGQQSDHSPETALLFKQLVEDVALLKATARDDSLKFGGLGLPFNSRLSRMDS